MKTANLPSLRVEPELRAAVESVLADGETVSGFIESSVRVNVERRRQRAEFLARGLASLAQAEATGTYHPAAQVLGELTQMLEARRAELQKQVRV